MFFNIKKIIGTLVVIELLDKFDQLGPSVTSSYLRFS